MRIKMLTTSAGPDPDKNWTEGQKRDIDPAEAAELVKAGLAVALDAAPVETADVEPEEIADGQPEETADVAPAEVRAQRGGRRK